jgi:hypothetical protein
MTPLNLLASVVLLSIAFWVIYALQDEHPWLEPVFGLGSPLVLIFIGWHWHINWLVVLGLGFCIVILALYVWFGHLVPYFRKRG